MQVFHGKLRVYQAVANHLPRCRRWTRSVGIIRCGRVRFRAHIAGPSDAGIRFDDLCSILRRLGFAERVRGSHHIFTRDGITEILNIQPRGSMAKPYQVKQASG